MALVDGSCYAHHLEELERRDHFEAVKNSSPRKRGKSQRRSVALALFVAFLTVSHEPPGPAPERSPGFSAPVGPVVVQPSARRSWRRHYEVLMRGLQVGRINTIPRKAFSTLQQDTLVGLDPAVLIKKLQNEAWSMESLLVKPLSRVKAKNLSAWVGLGGMRHLSFEMPMSIPWKQIEIVEGWTRSASEDTDQVGSEVQAEEQSQLVSGTIRFTAQDDILSADVSFHMSQPILNRMIPRMQLHMQPAYVAGKGPGVKVWFGGLVEWKQTCHFMIRKPMERGFLLGLQSYSLAVMDEIRQWAAQNQLQVEVSDEKLAPSFVLR